VARHGVSSCSAPATPARPRAARCWNGSGRLAAAATAAGAVTRGDAVITIWLPFLAPRLLVRPDTCVILVSSVAGGAIPAPAHGYQTARYTPGVERTCECKSCVAAARPATRALVW